MSQEPEPTDFELEVEEKPVKAEKTEKASTSSAESAETSAPPKEPLEPGVPPPTHEAATIAKLLGEITTLKDQSLRALAEAENTRKRAERDREDASKYAIANFARGLLSVADNLHRALESIPADLRASETRLDSLVMGIEATEREMLAAFDKVGIKKIHAMDQPFNANFHEVIVEIPGTGKPAGAVVQVVEDGYMIFDRLLRPARVGVAKADLGSASESRTFDEKV